MIDRLVQIELESFRAYGAGARTVDLDADVVLIHGRNGSGKTSLLSAIEYAVTGEVDHLRPYKKDYAHVIGHIGDAPESARVRLTARAKDNSEDSTERTVERLGDGGVSNPFSKSTRQTFLDRSYLSQAQLARLLHIYQEPGKRNVEGDPPVIRFIRDLLDLKRLEALEAGLDVAGHVTRLRKSFEAYRTLEQQQQTLADARTDAAERAASSRDAERKLRAQFGAQCATADVVVPEGADAVAETLAQALSDVQAQADVLQRWINSAENIVQATPPPAPPLNLDPVPVEQARAVATLNLGQVTAILEAAQPAPYAASPNATHAVDAAVLRDRITHSRRTLATLVADNARQVQASVEAAGALGDLRARAAGIQVELEPLLTLGASLADDLASLRSALKTILVHVDGEMCPVCERDYSEEGGGLHAHVVERLASLGAQTARLEEQIRTRSRLMSERATLEKQIISTEATGRPAHTEALREREAALAQVPPLLDAASDALLVLDAAATRQAEVDAARRAFDAWQIASAARDAALQEASQLGLDDEPGTPADENLLTKARRRLAAFAARATSINMLKSSWVEVGKATAIRQAAEAAEVQATADQSAAEAAWRRVGALIDRARAVRKAASETTAELIKTTFDDRLSALVDDIYFRLVRDERFSPRLIPSGTGSQLTAAIHAYADGKPSGVSNAASLLSSANLNTAALSLFIALHLTAPAQPKTLVFDDPVQSMDDVHAANLAGLFRSLAYDPDPKRRRQLVIATHDRALFDYLALELSPARPEQRLLLQEITRLDSRTVSISPTERWWKQDKVRFQTAV